MENILFLILGWLLGLFGPWLTELIQKPYRRAQLKRSIFIELEDLRRKIAAVSFIIASESGAVDRKLLEWIEPIMSSEDSPQARGVKAMLGRSDEELQALSQAWKTSGGGLNLKKYTLPFLTSQMTSLSLFTPEFQRLALDIYAQLSILNEEIDVARFNYEKTFDNSLSKNSYAAVRTNLEQTYQNIAGLCRRLSETIGLILKKEK
ncbi:MAG TPA: hypothetical protein VF708_15575 [Pyrinomonadaceae bacterium]|jgi:hypothetical protein